MKFSCEPSSRTSALLFVFALAMAVGCVSPRPSGTGTISSAPTDSGTGSDERASTLGPGDLVEVRVFQETDLSGVFRLSPEGTVDYPLCGKVTLSAMTSSQAADIITKCLGGK